MPANIAATSFESGPDDSAVVVDIYGTPPQSPTNNLVDSILPMDKQMGSNSLGSVFGKDNAVGKILREVGQRYSTTGSLGINDVIKRFSNLSKLSKAELTNMHSKALGAVLGGFGFYNKDNPVGNAINGILGAVGGQSLEKTLLGGNDSINVLVGNVEKSIDRLRDLNSLSDLSTIVDSISGETGFIKIFNLGDTLAALKGINAVAKEFGIPGSIDRIINKFDDRDKKTVILGVAKDKNALFDIGYVEMLGSTFDTNTILSKNPTIIKDVLTQITATVANPKPTLEMGNRIIAALNQIDPNWDKTYFGGKLLTNLDIFTQANSYVKDCLKLSEQYQVEVAICNEYQVRSKLEIAEENYPWLTFA